MPKYKIGIDVGGTFTDLIAISNDGETLTTKVLSVKDDQSAGIIKGLKKLGLRPEEVELIGHGFTVGLNAVLTRTGDKVGLLATKGHRDNLDFGRMYRPWGKFLYDPNWMRPHVERPLVSRKYRRGITERILWDASELVALDEGELRHELEFLKKDGIDSIAICFLNAYLNDAHEERAKEIVREVIPDAYIQSSRLNPVVKEYERTITVVLDAYIGKIVSRYFDLLEQRLQDAGYLCDVFIMQFNGGFARPSALRTKPIYSLTSGPVAGVLGARFLGEVLGVNNLFTFDMGGTSTDLGVIRDGVAVMTTQMELEHAINVTLPMVEINTIGSGGGSIIYTDNVGALKVGPESAGSNPGPACYGFGGSKPTITDAHMVRGIIYPEVFGAGEVAPDLGLARKAFEQLADTLKLKIEDLALGSIHLATAQMAEAIRSISTYRGLDPRDYTLVAFGAAGPMHATDIARDLGIKNVIIPVNPGCFSAYGCCVADIKNNFAESHVKALDELGADGINESFRKLQETARKDLLSQTVPEEFQAFEWLLYGMYAGQTWDLPISIPIQAYDKESIAKLKERFHEKYFEVRGYKAEELPIIITTLEVDGYGTVSEKHKPPKIELGFHEVERGAVVGVRKVYFKNIGYVDTPFYDRKKLKSGNTIAGPAVIVEDTGTNVLERGDHARVDEQGNLRISVS